jgi:mRNA interferase MazF
MVIRGAVYRIDLGESKRGHEQRGKRLGLVLSPTSMPWSVATVVPTSTTAQEAVFRPVLDIDGQATRFLVDQIRSVDIDYIIGDPVHYLERDELAEVEHAVIRYLGL